MRHRLALDDRAQQSHQFSFLCIPIRHLFEALLRRQIRPIDGLAQGKPVAVMDRGDRDPAVRCAKDACRRAAGPHHTALENRRHHADRLQSGCALHQAGIQIAASHFVASPMQRRRHRSEGIQRSHHIDRDHRHPVRNPILAMVLGRQAGKGLQHRVHGRAVNQGPALPEAGDRQINDPGLAGTYRLVIEAEPLDHTRAKAFDEHIGALDQLPQHSLAVVLLQIDRHTALAKIADD